MSRSRHLGADGGELGQELVLLGCEVVGPGQQHPGESTWGEVAAVGIRAALVDVLAQKVQSAREAEGLDLFEEVLDRDAGAVAPAFSQVRAVAIDQAGTVLGDAEHARGAVCPNVALDGVLGQLQARGHIRAGPCLGRADRGPDASVRGWSGRGGRRRSAPPVRRPDKRCVPSPSSGRLRAAGLPECRRCGRATRRSVHGSRRR